MDSMAAIKAALPKADGARGLDDAGLEAEAPPAPRRLRVTHV
jgi:hypothetical protein